MTECPYKDCKNPYVGKHRHWAMLRIYPGLHIPKIFTIIGVKSEMDADHYMVVVAHHGIEPIPEGCVPVRYWTVERLIHDLKVDRETL